MANVTYKVVKGDTLSGIAKAKGTTVKALLALNPDILFFDSKTMQQPFH